MVNLKGQLSNKYFWIIIAIATVVLVLLGWYFLSDYKVEDVQFEVEQATRIANIDNIEREADRKAGIGAEHRQQAESAEGKLLKTKGAIEDAKNDAKKLDDAAAASGRNDIDDSDLPSNAELCARANSLGVRCDPDK